LHRAGVRTAGSIADRHGRAMCGPEWRRRTEGQKNPALARRFDLMQ
jgi:hypothetical protein